MHLESFYLSVFSISKVPITITSKCINKVASFFKVFQKNSRSKHPPAQPQQANSVPCHKSSEVLLPVTEPRCGSHSTFGAQKLILTLTLHRL